MSDFLIAMYVLMVCAGGMGLVLILLAIYNCYYFVHRRIVERRHQHNTVLPV